MQVLVSNASVSYMFCCCTKALREEQQIVVIGRNNRRTTTDISEKNLHQMKPLLSRETSYKVVIGSKYETYLRDCEATQQAFIDKEFPHHQSSLQLQSMRQIIWKRAGEILSDYKLVEGTIEPADVLQGNIGDCYFLASLSSLAEQPRNIENIFCGQLNVNKYGIYRIVISTAGKLREVLLDDYFPVYADNPTRTVFCKPHNNEIWVMLLEKAWAKINGSYGAIKAGFPHEVLNTFSPAACFYYPIPYKMEEQKKNQLWAALLEAEEMDLTVCCGSRPDHTCPGITQNHTHSLLASVEILRNKQTWRIIKLRNPWGHGQFKGSCSQYDRQFWKEVKPQVRAQLLGEGEQDDGTYTIEYNQFLRNFGLVDICHSRDRFSYHFYNLTVKPKEPLLYTFRVQSSSQLYLTLQDTLQLKQNKPQSLRMVVVRMISGSIGIKVVNEYEWISSARETNFQDVSLHLKKLEQGQYLVMMEIQGLKVPREATLAVYAQAYVSVEPILLNYQEILRTSLTAHAQANPTKTFLKEKMNPKGWISYHIFEESALAYFYVRSSQTSQVKVEITFNLQEILQSGFRVIGKTEQNYCKLLADGQDAIIMFEAKTETTNFPPQGLHIKMIF